MKKHIKYTISRLFACTLLVFANPYFATSKILFTADRDSTSTYNIYNVIDSLKENSDDFLIQMHAFHEDQASHTQNGVLDLLRKGNKTAFQTRVKDLLKDYDPQKDTTGHFNILETLYIGCEEIGEYEEATKLCELNIKFLEKSSPINDDIISLEYQIIMDIAQKAKLYSIEAHYGQKFSRKNAIKNDTINFELFKDVERKVINAFLKANNFSAAIAEIDYTDSCLSKYNDKDSLFLQYLKMKRHIANFKYDLAYRESLNFFSQQPTNNRIGSDFIFEIADAMANVCNYDRAVETIKALLPRYPMDMDHKRDCLLRIGNYYFSAKDYKNANKYYSEAESIGHSGPSNSPNPFTNGDGYADDGRIFYDGLTSDSYYRVAITNYKLDDIKSGDLHRDRFLIGIIDSGKKFIGDYSDKFAMLEIARHEALNEYQEAIDKTEKLLEKEDTAMNDLFEDLAILYLKDGQADKAFNLSTAIIRERRKLILQNFDALSVEEKARLWKGKSDIFRTQMQASLLSTNPSRGSILYNDNALFSKGLLLTVSSNPDYKSILKTSWKDIQNKLKRKELAIEFIAVENLLEDPDSTDYIALVISKMMKEPMLIKLCKASDLMVSNIQQETSQKEIFKQIWSKIGNITDDIKTIYFSTDGILSIFPHEAIIQKYCKNIINLYRLTSTRELVIKHRKIKSRQSVLYGGLKYDISLHPMNSLTYTEDEINIVKDFLSSQRQSCVLFKGTTGTCATLNELNQREFSFLHIATHGYFDDDTTNMENAMSHCGLVMSDRRITAEEISNIQSNGIKMVVLSACNSGLGEFTNGDGVFGLQRAFKLAGAQTILMTLWNIDDAFTLLFMKKYYYKIINGNSFQKALLDTQEELRNYHVPGYGYPYNNEKYWAGFVLLDAIN